MNIGLDTTLVIRLLTGLPPEQFAVARGALEGALARGDELFVCDLVLAEAYFVLHAHYAVPKPAARAMLLDLLRSGVVVTEPGSDALRAFGPEGGAGPVDRLISGRHASLQAMTWTFDERLARLPGCGPPPGA